MKKLKILFLVSIMVGFFACHKDSEEEVVTHKTTHTPVILEETEGSISGYVYDDSKNPVDNATVILYSGSTTTNEYGLFHFDSIKLDKHGSYLKIKKSGFKLGSDYIYPTVGRNTSYTQLFSLNNASKFDAKYGGTIELEEEGAEINFLPNSIEDNKGSIFNGDVYLTAKFLSPEDPEMGNKMPGDLRAEDSNGYTVVLGTYGMMMIALRDDQGNELNLRDGKTAGLSFPLSDELASIAPDEIPLWYFDGDSGIWREEGKAILADGKYYSEVSHLSWWNCDSPFPVIHMCTKLLLENEEPVSGVGITVTVDGLLISSGITGSDGSICRKVPKGKAFTLIFNNSFCNEIVKSITVGPFENDLVIEDIIIPLPDKLCSGKAFCDKEILPGAQLVLKYTTPDTYKGVMLIHADADGSFTIPAFNCFKIRYSELFAYSRKTGNASNVSVLNVNTNNENLELDVCHE